MPNHKQPPTPVPIQPASAADLRMLAFMRHWHQQHGYADTTALLLDLHATASATDYFQALTAAQRQEWAHAVTGYQLLHSMVAGLSPLR